MRPRGGLGGSFWSNERRHRVGSKHSAYRANETHTTVFALGALCAHCLCDKDTLFAAYTGGIGKHHGLSRISVSESRNVQKLLSRSVEGQGYQLCQGVPRMSVKGYCHRILKEIWVSVMYDDFQMAAKRTEQIVANRPTTLVTGTVRRTVGGTVTFSVRGT